MVVSERYLFIYLHIYYTLLLDALKVEDGDVMVAVVIAVAVVVAVIAFAFLAATVLLSSFRSSLLLDASYVQVTPSELYDLSAQHTADGASDGLILFAALCCNVALLLLLLILIPS